MPETQDELKDRIAKQKPATPPAKGEVTGVQIGEGGKAEPKKDFDPSAKPSPKPSPTPDPDADEPGLGLAEKVARAKRRKAKADGQAAGLK
jgi:hypothetical protein